MMNDCRKSDKPIVPGKFSNKLDNVVAERMEGRGMPKENKRQQNMLRTQRRESVLSISGITAIPVKSGNC